MNYDFIVRYPDSQIENDVQLTVTDGSSSSGWTWTSSNPGAVKVEGSGASATVTALGATNGAVLISFSASGSTVSGNNAVTGLTGTCSVTVSDAAGSVSLDQSSMTLDTHLKLFEKGIAEKADFSYSGAQAGAIARMITATRSRAAIRCRPNS